MTELADKIQFGQKVNIILCLRNGSKPEMLAEIYNTTTEKIDQINDSQQRIMDLFQSSYLSKAQQLPLKRGLYPYMENLLYSWYIEQNNVVSNKALTEKAKEFLEMLNEQPTIKNFARFSGSNGWLTAFKERFGIYIARRKPPSTASNITVDLPELVLNEVKNFNVFSHLVLLTD